MIRQLLYISFSDILTEDTILDILEHSQKNNAQLGLTGMLLYSDGIFCQLLEGDPDNVGFLFNKISKDDRHSHISVILDQNVPERLFAQWEIAFKQFKDEEQPNIEGWSDYLQNPNTALNTMQSNANIILSYLETFKQTL
jgi:inorganic pyrophosphatase